MKADSIEGVHVIKLVKHNDERGFLVETFRTDSLPQALQPVMSYISYTEPGVGRGPHEHESQTDIFAFVGPGNFKIYLWDNRCNSTTFRNRMIVVAGLDNPATVIVPPGVVHAYRNISKTDQGMVLNYPDRLYAGWGKKEPVDEIRHEHMADDYYLDFIE
jgi:dTDP-4-dehydrorhamnose 3,5-epimerase